MDVKWGRTGLIRQGDVLLVPVDEIPLRDGRPVDSVRGRFVLMEGEATGHAHTVPEEGAQLVTVEQAEQLYLEVYGAAGVPLTHDEHATLVVPRGRYEVRRQREWSDEERWAWVND